MKAIELTGFGTPSEVCHCIDIAPPESPAADEVTVEILACPINPAELLLLSGKYASRPPVPYRPGIEAVGRVTAIGAEVDHVSVGDKVISLGRQNWQQSINLPANSVIVVPAEADTKQLAMLKINPATALLMLSRYVELHSGDWVVQNAANSGVGHSLIQLAKAQGFKTINIVRREELIEPLTGQGADAVLVDGPDIAERCAEIVADDTLKLAIDAIAGDATQRLAECLQDDGVVVNYGLLSGQPCQIAPDQLVFRSISLTGFWLAKLMGNMSLNELQQQYTLLAEKLVDGTLHTPVEQTYPLEGISDALDHAGKSQRDGKILLLPNGAV